MTSPRFGSAAPATGWQGAPATEPNPARPIATMVATSPAFESATARFGSPLPPSGGWAPAAPASTPASASTPGSAPAQDVAARRPGFLARLFGRR